MIRSEAWIREALSVESRDQLALKLDALENKVQVIRSRPEAWIKGALQVESGDLLVLIVVHHCREVALEQRQRRVAVKVLHIKQAMTELTVKKGTAQVQDSSWKRVTVNGH